MPSQTAQHKPHLLDISGYFILPAVALPLLWELFAQQAPLRWIISGVFALIAIVFSLRDTLLHGAPWRRTAYTMLQTALIALLLALPPHPLVAVILFFVLSAEVTMMYSTRATTIWISLFSLITMVAYIGEMGLNGVLSFPIYVAGYIFFAIFARQTANAEAARAESERLLDELQAAHVQLQVYAAQVEELAVQQERNRLAREMHDTLGHRLTVASVQLQAAQRLISTAPERAGETIGVVQTQISEGLGELRRTVASLRAPVEADLALAPALKRLAGHFQEATGIQVHLDLADTLPELPASQRHALYRGAQEALTNVQKHAHARTVWIELARQDNTMALRVRDDGLGPADAATAPSFGLHGLRERAAQLGGKLAFGPAEAGGAQLTL
ncbi:MAG: sensor histidine kinase, partial [Anaerolineae bacterium]